ncbi:MAG: endolytic transglycosylase MltG [Alphaproteobacteria bacterium]
MARGLIRAALLFFTLVTVVLAVLAWGRAQFERPGPLERETTVILARGIGLAGIAATLAEEGVIESPLVFTVGVRLIGADRRLQAGEYAFPAAVSAREVVDVLMNGRIVVRRVTVPEGLTSMQVVALLEATDGLTGSVDRVPEEGSLLPETYHFSFGDRRAELIARMQEAMPATLTELWADRAPDLPFTRPKDAQILASIVEKETALEEEHRRIAGVFINRLRRNMRLQSDPTVVYGITGGAGPLDRPLTREDLERKTPYNTYLISGLPPGPIANPGRAAIAAVLNPAETDELYFVADGKGGHAFARTLEEHNRNVARWHRLRGEGGDQ